MKTLFFTVQNRRSLLTTRLVYGLEGMKYIIQIYEGEINGHGEKERLPEEFQYEFEQEMLKQVHELRNELREKGWTQRDLPPEVHQPSFLRSDESDAQLGSSLIEREHPSEKPKVRSSITELRMWMR